MKPEPGKVYLSIKSKFLVRINCVDGNMVIGTCIHSQDLEIVSPGESMQWSVGYFNSSYKKAPKLHRYLYEG